MATIHEALQHALSRYEQQDYAEAEKVCRDVLKLAPDCVDALHLTGLCCRKTERQAESIDVLRRAVEIAPDRPVLFFELGIVLQQHGDLEDAFHAYRRAVELKPDFQEVRVNAGATLDELGRHEEAVAWYEQAAALRPDCKNTWTNMGNAFQNLQKFDEAIRCYRRALAIDPQCPKANWNCSMAYLRVGRFGEGWDQYEWREAAGEAKLDVYPQPAWDGSPLAGRTLLVRSEQGVGDEILFASCYPDLIAAVGPAGQAALLAKSRSDRLEAGPASRDGLKSPPSSSDLASKAACPTGHCVIVCEPRLVKLFARSFPETTVIGHRRRNDRSPPQLPPGLEVDFQITAGSVPRFLRRRSEDFPQRESYLQADSQQVEMWRKRFAELGAGLKIGISWRAGGKPSELFKRTTGLELWQDIFAVPHTHFVNLQYGQCEEDIARARRELGVVIHDWDDADPLTELDTLAAQIAALDLVIAVGNTTVHLAGALGQLAWALIPTAPSWRWMSEIDRVPWYTSVRLFRQQRGESWSPVLERVRQELCRYVGVTPSQPAVPRKLVAAEKPTADEASRAPQQVSVMKFVARLGKQMEQAAELHRAEKLAEAEAIYREVLKHTPQHVDALHLLGVICQQTGRAEAAVKLLRQALTLHDGDANFHYHLGLALADTGRIDEAMSCYRRASELRPDFPEPLLNLGSALKDKGERQQAVELFRRVAELMPESATPHFNLGATLRELGRNDEALEAFLHAIELQPRFPEALVHVGQLYEHAGQRAKGLAAYRQAVRIRPDYATALSCLANAYHALGKIDEAILAYEQALSIKPNWFEMLVNLGNAFRDQDQPGLAIAHYRRAIRLRGDHPQALLNLLMALRREGQLGEALEVCERLLSQLPDHAEAHVQRALIWLQQGDYRRGWPEFAWRHKTPSSVPMREAIPHWDGTPLAGRSLLIHAEPQPHDQIMFASCLPDLIDRGGRVTVCCEAGLLPFFARSFPRARIIPIDSSAPGAYDFQIPLGGLPQFLRPTAESFPQRQQYLVADTTRMEALQQQLSQLPPGLRVGLLWSAGKESGGRQSPRASDWRTLLGVRNVQFVRLAPDSAGLALAANLHRLIDIRAADWDQLAALVASLDLVIGIDHPLAHLAGALGCPVWNVLPHAWGWRWQLGREDTPWYPSMQLFRPANRGGWHDMFERMRRVLDHVAGNCPSSSRERTGDRADPPHGSPQGNHRSESSRRLCESAE